MEVKMLDLRKDNKSSEIVFDEYLNLASNRWSPANSSFKDYMNKDAPIAELNIQDDYEYRYFLVQCKDGAHLIYRMKWKRVK